MIQIGRFKLERATVVLDPGPGHASKVHIRLNEFPSLFDKVLDELDKPIHGLSGDKSEKFRRILGYLNTHFYVAQHVEPRTYMQLVPRPQPSSSRRASQS